MGSASTGKGSQGVYGYDIGMSVNSQKLGSEASINIAHMSFFYLFIFLVINAQLSFFFNQKYKHLQHLTVFLCSTTGGTGTPPIPLTAYRGCSLFEIKNISWMFTLIQLAQLQFCCLTTTTNTSNERRCKHHLFGFVLKMC